MAKTIKINIKTTARPSGSGIRVTSTVSSNGRTKTTSRTIRPR